MPDLPQPGAPNYLRTLPDEVRATAERIASNEDEVLVGWKPLQERDAESPTGYSIDRFIIVTDVGYYEVNLHGVCMRAAVLHSF